MRRRWPPLLLALLALLAPLALPAQTPAARIQLAALRDSVTQMASADEATTAASAERSALQRDKSDALLLMQAGLTQLRVGQLSTDRAPLDQAQAYFDEAIYRAPDNWPWPWYGLALTDLALDSAGVVVKPSMHQASGTYYRRAAIIALTRSLEADSSFVPAAAVLASLIIPEADQDLDRKTERAIRRAAAQPGAVAAQLALGRILRNLGHPDSSLRAFRTYVSDGGDTAVGLLESARMLNALDSIAAASSAYYAGAATVDGSLGLTAYRKDIAWVASDAEVAAFDSLPMDSVEPWLRRFWAKRDAREVRAPGERLAEHFRRWRYVYQHFQVVGRKHGTTFDATGNMGGSADQGDEVPSALANAASGVLAATEHGQRVVDDRGVIYMRHGEPDKSAFAVPDGKGTSNLVWKYYTTTGPLIFQFLPSFTLGMQAPTTLVDLLPFRYRVYDAMTGIDPEYAIIAGQLKELEMDKHWQEIGSRMTASGGKMGSVTSKSWNIVSRIGAERLRTERRHDLDVGLSTDGYPPHFEHPLTPRAQFYAVGEPGQVLVVFALDGSRLEADSLPDGAAGYPVTIRLTATNARGEVARIDTTRRFRSQRPLDKGQFLFGLETLRLGAGMWDIRLLTSEHGLHAGGAIGRIGVTVPSASAFGLSDLVLGRAGSGLTWQSSAGPVPLNPLDAFPARGSAELYYELHGAKPGATYQTDIEVEGTYGNAEGNAHLSFSETARDAFVRARRSIGLDKLEPGQYRITVTVREEGTDRMVKRERLLNVIR